MESARYIEPTADARFHGLWIGQEEESGSYESLALLSDGTFRHELERFGHPDAKCSGRWKLYNIRYFGSDIDSSATDKELEFKGTGLITSKMIICGASPLINGFQAHLCRVYRHKDSETLATRSGNISAERLLSQKNDEEDLQRVREAVLREKRKREREAKAKKARVNADNDFDLGDDNDDLMPNNDFDLGASHGTAEASKSGNGRGSGHVNITSSAREHSTGGNGKNVNVKDEVNPKTAEIPALRPRFSLSALPGTERTNWGSGKRLGGKSGTEQSMNEHSRIPHATSSSCSSITSGRHIKANLAEYYEKIKHMKREEEGGACAADGTSLPSPLESIGDKKKVKRSEKVKRGEEGGAGCDDGDLSDGASSASTVRLPRPWGQKRGPSGEDGEKSANKMSRCENVENRSASRVKCEGGKGIDADAPEEPTEQDELAPDVMRGERQHREYLADANAGNADVDANSSPYRHARNASGSPDRDQVVLLSEVATRSLDVCYAMLLGTNGNFDEALDNLLTHDLKSDIES